MNRNKTATEPAFRVGATFTPSGRDPTCTGIGSARQGAILPEIKEIKISDHYEEAVDYAHTILRHHLTKELDAKPLFKLLEEGAARSGLPIPQEGWHAFLHHCLRNDRKTLWPYLKAVRRNPRVRLTEYERREWQIQTLVYESGVIPHSVRPPPCTALSPYDVAIIPNRDVLDLYRRKMDSEGKPLLRYTGERAAELVRMARGDPTSWWKALAQYGFAPPTKKRPKGNEQDPIAWEAACRLAAAILEQGDPLPPELNKFAVEVLRDPSSRPKRKGRNVADHVMRDKVISHVIVNMRENCKYTPTMRNAASDHFSVCDAVAEAATKLGENIGYDAVVKAWKGWIKRGGPRL